VYFFQKRSSLFNLFKAVSTFFVLVASATLATKTFSFFSSKTVASSLSDKTFLPPVCLSVSVSWQYQTGAWCSGVYWWFPRTSLFQYHIHNIGYYLALSQKVSAKKLTILKLQPLPCSLLLNYAVSYLHIQTHLFSRLGSINYNWKKRFI